MAELTPQERLQPALLDRLTDDEPTETAPSRASSGSCRKRSCARRCCATSRGCSTPCGQAPRSTSARRPQARHSVLNFGLPALSGSSASMLEDPTSRSAIREAIKEFEPRILADGLRVRAIVNEDALDHHNVIGIEIQGQLWAQPVPLELLVRTEIDLETGKVEIADVASPRSA